MRDDAPSDHSCQEKLTVSSGVVEASNNHYDQIPYKSYAHNHSQPDRLATIATLFGMTPAPIEHGRVLELGCCSGGNIIPLAERFPEAKFLGIDNSPRQIADGHANMDGLGLGNVSLECRDILHLGPELGQFDYIIAHGVYSWVPPAVREKVLFICQQNLHPSGVAYLSYNTYPGWYLRGIIRDILLYQSRDLPDPADRIRHGRELIDALARMAPRQDNVYGVVLRQEAEVLRGMEDHVLHHDYMEPHNNAVYFSQLMEEANSHGLQYLGDAEIPWLLQPPSPTEAPDSPDVMDMDASARRIRAEQHFDFTAGRMFRKTLLCHRDVALDRSPTPLRAMNFHVASSARPESAVDLRSKVPAVFRAPIGAATMTEPLAKAALLQLSELWPGAIPMRELLAAAGSRVSSACDGYVQNTVGAERTLADLTQLFAARMVDFSTTAPSFISTLSARPLSSAFARREAERGNRVTNRRHESPALSDLQRNVLGKLDGQHDREALLEHLIDLAERRLLEVREQGTLIQDPNRLRQLFPAVLEATLSELAQLAFLIA